jgi:uncharacterized protein (DUF433 family)
MTNVMERVIEYNPVERLPISVDKEIMGGEPVFAGTRVPVKSLFEHLETNCTLDEFLEWFPTVQREAAVTVLMAACKLTYKQVLG